MDIKTRISLDVLNEYSVTVKTQKYMELEGEELNVGELHARAYANSERGRAELAEEVSEAYLSGVLSVWGEESKVKEEMMI